MGKFKEFLDESKFTSQGEYLKFGKSITSLGDDSAVIVSNKEDTAKIYLSKGKIVFMTNKYDKEFKSINDLVKYLNKEKFQYDGINNI